MQAIPFVPSGWTPCGDTVNCQYFSVAGDVLVVAPHVGVKDTGELARVNLAFQTDWAARQRKKVGVVVMMGSLLGQDADARRTYAEGMKPELFYAIGLVVENALARAIGSFFMGLSRPPVPTRMFDSSDAAIAWVETQRPAQRAA